MNVALAGFGQEGRASYEYWTNLGDEVTIADERDTIDDLPDGAATILGKDSFSKLGGFDLIVRSPGINPNKLPYGEKVWSATNEFFDKCPAEIIGVTGTKGKGTTSSLIASILKAAGKTVHLVGNIGTPALAELSRIGEDDAVVYELSSFQLWDATMSPHVAVVLKVEPDHLDVHESEDDYRTAKANILRAQSEDDYRVLHTSHRDSPYVPDTGAFTVWYPDPAGCHAQDGWFYAGERKLCRTDALRIPGPHNIENACAAIAAASYLIPAEHEQDMERIFSQGLGAFDGLPHRLKFVAEKHGVRYYDDSIATTPGSAIAALASFDQPKVIILGGHDKGADYTELVESCERSGATVITIGANGPAIARVCREAGVPYVEEAGNMTDIVNRAAATAGEGSVVILSPAAASFDMFKSYADRGDQFVAAVTDL